ncbi:MAG TPA: radical SAM protein [Bacillota bacterium]|jgi:pyruvate-formate lyase-activating enzyme
MIGVSAGPMAVKAAAEWGARRYGVLPITSVCDMSCLFCSNRQNPSGVTTFQLGPRTAEEVRETLGWMEDPERIVVGESVTRIDEGEPFTHPQLLDLLSLAREGYPRAVLQVTTNGSRLTREAVRGLAALSPVEVIVSLNSAVEANRRRLMGDGKPQRALSAIDFLAEAGLPFQGSLVALPHLVGWDDPARTVSFLDERGASLIRIFLPGYTKLAPTELRFPLSLWDDLARLVDDLAGVSTAPLVLEPPRLTDLAARVEGVAKDGPAAKAGIRRGDVIRSVDGDEVISRFDAHVAATEAGPARLVVDRPGAGELSIQLVKEPDERPGFVVHYDLDPARLHHAAELLHNGPRPATVLTSTLAGDVVRLGLVRVLEPEALQGVAVEVVENAFFGGSIMTAGLTVVSDYLRVLGRIKVTAPAPRLILVPWEPWDQDHTDLTGRSLRELKVFSGAEVELV